MIAFKREGQNTSLVTTTNLMTTIEQPGKTISQLSKVALDINKRFAKSQYEYVAKQQKIQNNLLDKYLFNVLVSYNKGYQTNKYNNTAYP